MMGALRVVLDPVWGPEGHENSCVWRADMGWMALGVLGGDEARKAHRGLECRSEECALCLRGRWDH